MFQKNFNCSISIIGPELGGHLCCCKYIFFLLICKHRAFPGALKTLIFHNIMAWTNVKLKMPLTPTDKIENVYSQLSANYRRRLFWYTAVMEDCSTTLRTHWLERLNCIIWNRIIYIYGLNGKITNLLRFNYKSRRHP